MPARVLRKRPAAGASAAAADEAEEEPQRKVRRTAAAGEKKGKEQDVSGYAPLDFFCYYVRQVSLKHGKTSARADVHPYVRDHGFPPAGISHEINLRFVQKYLRKRVAGNDLALQVIIMGAFQAPDQPFCFKEMLPHFLAGVKAHRREGYRQLLGTRDGNRKAVGPHFQKLEAALHKRYVRGIDPALIASGERKGNVYGYGEVGIYNAEHQTSIMPGLTHPEGLRWKLEHWPLWLEKAILPLLSGWPDCRDRGAVEAMLESRFPKQLPHGVRTEIDVAPGGRRRRILDMFSGDVAYATSALSQALLFAEMLKPTQQEHKQLRRHGLGAGTFTVRGFWMAYHRDRTFKSLDTATFCPGFTGALKGAEAVKVAKFTGVQLSCAEKGSINWGSWQCQLRFGAWLHALQRHLSAAAASSDEGGLARAMRASGVEPRLHCSEVEAGLCFMSRLVTMFEEPEGSQAWQAASRGIGSNLPASLMATLFK